DHVMGWSTSVIAPPDGDMGQYLASLEKLAMRDDRILYPTHGSPIREPRAWLAELLAHRRLREKQIVDALAQGVLSIPALLERLYPDIDARLRAAAALQIKAHLDHLRDRGLVTEAAGQWLRSGIG
ncbi:MAG: MBL fold metallo-hydrolase, partial [Alphaproteobacteria bacterium]|nr:MBL fold metallo-hydrolase [Alphaproteobacteria bacterium]